jgi:hypothetical protein
MIEMMAAPGTLMDIEASGTAGEVKDVSAGPAGGVQSMNNLPGQGEPGG